MKISMFHLMPHRELPQDFEKRYHSVWVDPPFHELATPERIGTYYNWSLDELIHAAKAGLDGVCVNEHHQNAYGMMPSPNLMGAILARATNGLKTAVIQMGSTLPTTNPPIRVAEEYAMLDCISGGRMVAGMPPGTAMDVNLCYGITPLEHRERHYEAHDLIMKAWAAREPFAWNGKYFKLPMVNLWPRPVQQPHPPVWIPGSSSVSTWEFAGKNDHCYCNLSYFGHSVGQRVVDGFWEFTSQKGFEENPYRLGFLQLIAVSETDARAEQEYFPHIQYFYNRCLHFAPEFYFIPGNMDYRSLVDNARRFDREVGGFLSGLGQWKFRDYVEKQVVIAGSPATVRDQLMAAVKRLRTGNLMALLHIGSMPHELTLKNIDLFAKEVLPHFRDLWDDRWENRWWPQPLRQPRTRAVGAEQTALRESAG
jgi:alkanesulfonate monooxygenase SsuD/methylene tetrahydromethanopterin reductase-like flavin-dependent oxidoreductase (luciferase family)